MELNDKVTQLEDEIKILKNEVQAVLLDLRESYLNNENPFQPTGSYNGPAITVQSAPPVFIDKPTGTNESAKAPEPPAPAPVESIESVEKETPSDEELPVETAPESVKKKASADIMRDLEEGFPGEPDSASEPVNFSEPRVIKKTDTEDDFLSLSSDMEAVLRFKPNEETETSATKAKIEEKLDIDLAIIDTLARWVEDTVENLGHDRTRFILDISETMGYVNPDLKNIMVRFIHPAVETTKEIVPTKDYLSALVELNNLVGKKSESEIALLYILCQENENR